MESGLCPWACMLGLGSRWVEDARLGFIQFKAHVLGIG